MHGFPLSAGERERFESFLGKPNLVLEVQLNMGAGDAAEELAIQLAERYVEHHGVAEVNIRDGKVTAKLAGITLRKTPVTILELKGRAPAVAAAVLDLDKHVREMG